MDSDEQVALLRRGVVGTFMPVAENAPEHWHSGSLRLTDDGAEFAIIASSPDDLVGAWTNDAENHRVVFGITEVGTVLARIKTRSITTTRGDFVVRVVRWKAPTLLMNVNNEEVDGDTACALSLKYFDVVWWSGHRTVDHEPIQEHKPGPVVGWRIEARFEEPVTADIDNDFTVTIGKQLEPVGTQDKLAIHAPLIVRIASTERHPFGEHLLHLDAFHALLSIAHHESVSAAEGYARLGSDDERSVTKLWDRTMMEITFDDQVSNPFPIFNLDDIGGTEGVAAWLRTCQTRRRAVTPLVKHRLFRNQTPESRLLSTAAALENWVASHRRGYDWARKKNGDDTIALAAVRSVAPAWREWIGESNLWAAKFTDCYRSLKHNPDAEIDIDVVDALEFAARWLLTASILDECAGTHVPSDRIFTRGLAYPTGGNIRRVLGSDTATDG